MEDYLFVYGTLRRGYDNYFAQRLAKHGEWKGNAIVNGRLFHYKWYPVAIFEPSSPNQIIGEIYQIKNNDLLVELDEYEGINENLELNEYERITVDLQINKQAIKCWFYQFKGDTTSLKQIESGDFLNL